MDRVFVEYYEEELSHIRALASEFADMHPAVARNLSLD
ncbi:type VI secretion system baseplate subunit TssF, partial [Mesorhizobium sp. M7A.F.Ca.CA.001.05.1.1]